ncbi:MAG: hypothetical protein IPP80_13295 [Ignavibacteria bacterium]|nr:hypothetical protein [Ignavibacteria bacterium]
MDATDYRQFAISSAHQLPTYVLIIAMYLIVKGSQTRVIIAAERPRFIKVDVQIRAHSHCPIRPFFNNRLNEVPTSLNSSL